MRLTLLRHGETEWNRTGRAQGWQGTTLNAEGRRQAELLAEFWREERFDRVWSSDLLRCRETIAPWVAATHSLVEYRADLRERSFGDWEGERYSWVGEEIERRARASGLHPSEVRPPNGESFEDVYERLHPFKQVLDESDGECLVVSHGGTLGCLLARLFGAGHQASRAFRFRNTGLATVQRRADGSYSLQTYNDARHLEVALVEAAT